MAGRTRPKNKPHTQIGQKGKGKNKPKGQTFPPYKTAGLPIELGQFPQAPPQIPNFLPNTAAFEHGQAQANDALSFAGNQYGNAVGMIGPQFDLAKARLNTDMGVQTDRLKENLAERGVYTAQNAAGNYGASSPAGGGVGESMYGREIATPFGRANQDLASGAAGAYADAASQYGAAQLGYGQDMFDLYNQRGNDAFEMSPLSVPVGGYNLPNMPGPQMTSGVRVGGGRTRPNKNRNRNRGGNRGRR